LYLTTYDSFEAWGKNDAAIEKNKALSAELERVSLADGELLDSVDSVVYTYSDELSYRPHPDLAHARYVEISVFHVRGGHGQDWRKLARIVKDTHQKAGTSAHWAMFEVAYGADDGTYLAISADKSMADIDTGLGENEQFEKALGEDGLKEFRELFAATVDVSRSELFAINPRQSYVPEEWIKADPEFWKPKPAAPPAPKPAAAEKKAKP
jgi:hypothetical protein